MSYIAPTLVRKGLGSFTVLDGDEVEVSNLNRQRFYQKDIGRNKAFALIENLEAESTGGTRLRGFAMPLEAAIGREVDLSCDVAICAVDNNPARVVAARHFRSMGVPVVFTAVSADGDHGYVFVQQREGPCLGCLLPDIAEDGRFPCPGTPAIADILQLAGALSVYGVDTCVMKRRRSWNYRRVFLADGGFDAAQQITVREDCRLLTSH